MVLQSELLEVAEVQITYKPKFKVSERPQISRSQHAYNILMKPVGLG
jgi:DNA repair protein RadC